MPEALVREAAFALEEKNIAIRSRASLWHSPAWPDPTDPPYVNSVVEVETQMSPAGLLSCLHEVEAQFSRTRRALNAPRTLDLDILDYRGQVSTDAGGPLLPHPRAHMRAFVLLPLQEIAPGWRHPVSGQPIASLVAALPADEIAGMRRIGPFKADSR